MIPHNPGFSSIPEMTFIFFGGGGAWIWEPATSKTKSEMYLLLSRKIFEEQWKICRHRNMGSDLLLWIINNVNCGFYWCYNIATKQAPWHPLSNIFSSKIFSVWFVPSAIPLICWNFFVFASLSGSMGQWFGAVPALNCEMQKLVLNCEEL